MQKIPIYHVDAFTDKAFGGNPAAVVTNAQSLNHDAMQKIAQEMNLSETAFVLDSSKADFQLKWFTPKREVLFCGHATVATFHVLAQRGLYGMETDGAYDFKIETLSGILDIKVKKEKSEIKVFLKAPEVKLVDESIDIDKLSQALNINPTKIKQDISIKRDLTVDYVFITVQDLKSLEEINYNYAELEKLGEAQQIKGFTLLCKEAYKDSSHIHSRFFTPYYGVAEDPVTGSSNAPLAAYAIDTELLNLEANNDEFLVNAEQGHIMGRPGELQIKVRKGNKKGNYKSELIGKAVTLFHGELNLTASQLA